MGLDGISDGGILLQRAASDVHAKCLEGGGGSRGMVIFTLAESHFESEKTLHTSPPLFD